MLFSEIVYGPIHSRRLGTSLGINLMPTTQKICSFNCVYCECGFNQPVNGKIQLPTVKQFSLALENKLQQLQTSKIDVITFSGNGEPTMHPKFSEIIDETIILRNLYAPEAKISVLSNSTQLYKREVVNALWKADNRILKLDSAITPTMQLIDDPADKHLTPETIIRYLKQFDGDFILQTCFLKGQWKGQTIDNTTTEELNAWYKAVRLLQPKELMIYVIDRATPVKTLEKIAPETMQQIAEPLIKEGFKVIISA